MSIIGSNMTVHTLFVIDQSNKKRVESVRKAIERLSKDLEYHYDIYGIKSSIQMTGKLSKLYEMQEKGIYINILVIDDRVGDTVITPGKLGKIVAHGGIGLIVPVFNKSNPKEYFDRGFYKGIFEKDLIGADLIYQLVTDGRTEEEARNYYGIKDIERPSQELIRNTINDMVDTDIKKILDMTQGGGEMKAILMYKDTAEKKSLPYMSRIGGQGRKRRRK